MQLLKYLTRNLLNPNFKFKFKVLKIQAIIQMNFSNNLNSRVKVKSLLVAFNFIQYAEAD